MSSKPDTSFHTHHELYGGSVGVDFYPLRKGGYRYKVFDKKRMGRAEWVPGGTTPPGILDKPNLAKWQRRIAVDDYIKRGDRDHAIDSPDRVRDEAADTGTIIHDYAQQIMLGAVFDLGQVSAEHKSNAEIMNGVKAALAFKSDYRPEVMGAERVVYSRKHKIAGTCDLYCRIPKLSDYPMVADFKTSAGYYCPTCKSKTCNDTSHANDRVYLEYKLQVGGCYVGALEEELQRRIERASIVRLDKDTGEYEVLPFSVTAQIREAWDAVVTCYQALKPLRR